MKIRGKLNIEAKDILFYKCVATVARDISQRIANELTPTFIVEEAMEYYSSLEEYETCQVIKKFYNDNPSFFIDISRAEWFDTISVLERK